MKNAFLKMVGKLEIVDPLDRPEFTKKQDKDENAMTVAELKKVIYELQPIDGSKLFAPLTSKA